MVYSNEKEKKIGNIQLFIILKKKNGWGSRHFKDRLMYGSVSGVTD